MHQWEIYEFPYPDAGNPHPCIIISPDKLAQNKDVPGVNVIACTTLRPGTAISPAEMPLDAEDGLSHLTVARCHFILSFSKSAAGKRYGEVSMERRQIGRKIIDLWGLLSPITSLKDQRTRSRPIH